MPSLARSWRLVVACAAAFLGAARAPARGEVRPQGWASEAIARGSAEKVAFASPTPHLALGAGEAIHPLVAPGGFELSRSCVLAIPAPGRYAFTLEAEGGEAKLTLFDPAARKVVELVKPASARGVRATSQPVQLAGGDHNLLVTFSRAGEAPARLRVLWESPRSGAAPGFAREPLREEFCSVPAFARDRVEASESARRGRVLLGELGCVHCHQAQGDSHQGAHSHASAAVAARSAPRLDRAGERFSRAWMAKWIASPTSLRPNTAMPDVIPADAPADADDIAAYLSSLGDRARPATPVASESSVLEEGRRLFHAVGCVACHGALASPAGAFPDLPGLPASKPDSPARVPLGSIAGKWNVAELSAFVREPSKLHPGGRMPSLNLSVHEADLVAHYLARELGDAGSSEPPAREMVARGKAAFSTRGCVACHETGEPLGPAPRAPTLDELAQRAAGASARRGCLDENNISTPRYALDDRDRADLRAGIVEAARAGHAPAPLDELSRALDAASCRSCHAVDGVGGLPAELAPFATGQADLGDEGRLPPNLSGVGGKLTTPWLGHVLGEGARARPYMNLRMPVFDASLTRALPRLFAAREGLWPDADSAPAPIDDSLVLAGQKLVGEDGLNCISCHTFGRAAPAGTPGPNITEFAERLRGEWWSMYALDPARHKPGTRMPNFFATGRSQATGVLEGDPARQLDALWSYFSLSFAAPSPKGLPESGRSLQLQARDRPRVIRTFLQDAGARGVAIGHPSGRHFAYDATSARLVGSWKGDFLNAAGAWSNRGGEVAGGRAPSDWTAPDGSVLCLAEPEARWPDGPAPGFDGYDLDALGIPTFRSTLAQGERTASLAEKFVPRADGSFVRTLVVDRHDGRAMWVNPGPASELARTDGAEAVRSPGRDWFRVAPAGRAAVTLVFEVKP